MLPAFALDYSNDIREALKFEHWVLRPSMTILGGRKRILFVEGTAQSLDRCLYEVIYPGFTVHPVGGCSEVIQAVKGLRKSSVNHWVEAYGIIDGDGRSESDSEELENDGIFTLPTYSIESLFYGTEARRTIATNKAKELGEDTDSLLRQTTRSALEILSDHAERLAARKCCHRIQKLAIRQIPDWKYICENQNEKIDISISSPLAEEKDRFQNLLKNRDLDSLIALYPVRESSAFNSIANTLRYQSCNDYEAAVIECAKNDEQFRQALKDALPAIGNSTK